MTTHTGPQAQEAALTDFLAQEIRRVDGNHSLGAAALADALMPFITSLTPARVVSDDQLSELVSATQELMWAWKQPGERSMHQIKCAMDFAYDRASNAVEAVNVKASKE